MGKGRLTGAAYARLARLNELERAEAEAAFLRCCGSRRWARTMERLRPFHTRDALMGAAADVWNAMTVDDWRQAFAAHPRIGERETGVHSWSAKEQHAVSESEQDVLDELGALNAEYDARFGHIFITCATGRAASEILDELRARIENTPDDELVNAAREQARITELRLDKLLAELGEIG